MQCLGTDEATRLPSACCAWPDALPLPWRTQHRREDARGQGEGRARPHGWRAGLVDQVETGARVAPDVALLAGAHLGRGMGAQERAVEAGG